MQGGANDLCDSIPHALSLREPTGRIPPGANTGGSFAVCVAADDRRASSTGLLSPRADFDDRADHLRPFLDHACDTGVIRSRDFPPPSVEERAREFRRFRPVASVRGLAARPMLVMHCGKDDSVPVSDVRELVSTNRSEELSLFEGVGRRLRHERDRSRCCWGGWNRCDRRTSTRALSGSEPMDRIR